MREREFASFGTELAQVATKGRTLVGYASVFNYPIDSGVRGHEQTTYVRPGAFTKTLKENPGQVQVLLNHGQDPQVGMKPLGVPEVMRQDKHGLYVEVPLDPTSYNDDIIVSLSSGALRAMSIQFETTQEDYNEERTERYIQQVKLYEFGPVTFPANEAAAASLHSLAQFAVPLEFHWDGAAALRSCSTAAEFRQIAFERNNDSDPDTAAHWTLPHHPRPGAGADAQGVSAALAALHGGRGGPPDLKQSIETVEAHLSRHQSESSSTEGRATEINITVSADAPADDDRLTWTLEASQRLASHIQKLAEQEERIRRL